MFLGFNSLFFQINYYWNKILLIIKTNYKLFTDYIKKILNKINNIIKNKFNNILMLILTYLKNSKYSYYWKPIINKLMYKNFLNKK